MGAIPDPAVTYRCSICHAVYTAGERFCPRDAGAIAPDDGTGDPRIGRTIDGRYFIKRLVGRGGMGTVYEADHVGLDKRVAIKFLSINKTDRETLARFRREAKIASRIVHEHVVQIFDVGTADSDTDFIVMEFLEGRDLSVMLRDHAIDAGVRSASSEARSVIEPKGLPPDRALSIARKMLRGLRAIHQAGIVHRDIKPANVLLASRDDDHDFVKIMDFGISKQIEGGTVTQTGAVIGTPEYMAPEQLLAGDIDARADLYAVGLTMYRMLTGKLPFTGETFDRAAAASPYVAAPPIDSLRPGIAPSIAAVVTKAIAKERDDRYPDAGAMLAAIEAIDVTSIPSLGSSATELAPPSPPSRAPRQPSALEAADTAIASSAIRPPTVTGGGPPAAVAVSAVERPAPTDRQTSIGRAAPSRRTARWFALAGALIVVATLAAVLAKTAYRDEPAAGQGAQLDRAPSTASPAVGDPNADLRRRAREAERVGKLDDAIAAYLDAYAAEPAAETAFHLGELYQRQGKSAEAIIHFQRYLHMAPQAADRDSVTSRIAQLQASERPAKANGAGTDATESAPPSTPPRPPPRPTKACHCLSKDGLPDRQSLCSRKLPPRCYCGLATGGRLCPVAPASCASGDNDCDNGNRCPSKAYGKFVTPGKHDDSCDGYSLWTPNELSHGKFVCDVCPDDPPRQFRGQQGDPCTGYYRHTGQTIAGVMDCD